MGMKQSIMASEPMNMPSKDQKLGYSSTVLLDSLPEADIEGE